MKRIRAEVQIHSTPERVWEVLTDFGAYHRWNPSIRSIRGRPRPGERMTLQVALPAGFTLPVPVTVLQADAPRHLRWVGESMVPGIFRGEHSFLIEPCGHGRVTVVQEEEFTGLLVPLLAGWIQGHTLRGFQASCRVLKVVVEDGIPDLAGWVEPTTATE